MGGTLRLPLGAEMTVVPLPFGGLRCDRRACPLVVAVHTTERPAVRQSHDDPSRSTCWTLQHGFPPHPWRRSGELQRNPNLRRGANRPTNAGFADRWDDAENPSLPTKICSRSGAGTEFARPCGPEAGAWQPSAATTHRQGTPIRFRNQRNVPFGPLRGAHAERSGARGHARRSSQPAAGAVRLNR